MHPYLLLSLTLLLPLSTAASPLDHHSRFTKRRHQLRSSGASPPEYIEVTRPLPFESQSPSCKLQALSHSFGNTVDLLPTEATYTAPANCNWSRAVLHLSGASDGPQLDRITAVWLAGAEILRTSTPVPTTDGVVWNVRKDVTKYSCLLRQSNITLSVMLENSIDDVFTGLYSLNLTFVFYNTSNGSSGGTSKSPLISLYPPIRKLKNTINSSSSSKSRVPLNLNVKPADSIIPICAGGDEGFWFKIQSESDAVYQGVTIPNNTYRAVIEVYVSFHGDDEQWFTNPPDSYIEMNGLDTKSGHGAHREVQVMLDDIVVGSVVPFPVILPGVINPLSWEPVVAIGAFDLPTYEFELSPFLGMLLDGDAHYIGLGVAEAIPFWLINANLHLWLDEKVDKVQAGAIKYKTPKSSIERESTFEELNGKFQIERDWRSEFSGWVNCSAGNLTITASQKVKFESTVKFIECGTEKLVKQEVKVKNKVKVESKSGKSISNRNLEKKYPLKMSITTQAGSAEDTYLMFTKLEHTLEEQDEDGNYESELENTQKSDGWVFVRDHDLLSGQGTTTQSYSLKDNNGCYSRKVSAALGAIKSDTKNLLCSTAVA